MQARIDDAHDAAGGNNLGLQQRCFDRPAGLRIAARATAQDQSGDAHRCTSTALDVTAAVGGDSIAGVHPYGASANAHCRHRRYFAALWHERSCHTMVFIRRVQSSDESGVLDVPK